MTKHPFTAFSFSTGMADPRSLSIWKWMTGALLGAGGFTFSLSCLYHAMRAVMRLGGFIASGGPYVIAHPAPHWIWIVPVSIWTGIGFIFLHHVCALRLGAFSIMPLAWSATFLSLGINFLEFAFPPPPGHGIVVAWLICGIVFVLMGGFPFLYIVKGFREYRRERWQRKTNYTDEPLGERSKLPMKASILVLSAAAAGVIGSILFFRFLSR